MFKSTGPFCLTDSSYDYVSAEEFAERELLAYCPRETQSTLAIPVAEQLTALMNTKDPFTVQQTNNFHFPDGETYWLPYFLFHYRHALVGITRLNYGVVTGMERRNEDQVKDKPYCMIETVQGNLFVDARKYGFQREVRRTMLECILRTCSPLLKNGWNVGLRRKSENRSLRDPYFRDDIPYFCDFTSYDRNLSWRNTASCFGLDTRNRLVRRLLRDGVETRKDPIGNTGDEPKESSEETS